MPGRADPGRADPGRADPGLLPLPGDNAVLNREEPGLVAVCNLCLSADPGRYPVVGRMAVSGRPGKGRKCPASKFESVYLQI